MTKFDRLPKKSCFDATSQREVLATTESLQSRYPRLCGDKVVMDGCFTREDIATAASTSDHTVTQ